MLTKRARKRATALANAEVELTLTAERRARVLDRIAILNNAAHLRIAGELVECSSSHRSRSTIRSRTRRLEVATETATPGEVCTNDLAEAFGDHNSATLLRAGVEFVAGVDSAQLIGRFCTRPLLPLEAYQLALRAPGLTDEVLARLTETALPKSIRTQAFGWYEGLEEIATHPAAGPRTFAALATRPDGQCPEVLAWLAIHDDPVARLIAGLADGFTGTPDELLELTGMVLDAT